MDEVFLLLSYLPPNEISDGFTDVMAVEPSIAISFIFSDYILENYIESTAIFHQCYRPVN